MRTFLQDRIIQATLGTFVATFLFAMVVLAALPDQANQGLPELSLAVSIALVLVSSATFIYYLHHITTVMRVSHIIGSIGAQTRRSIAGLPPPDEPKVVALGEATQTVPTSEPGMISHVDLPCSRGWPASTTAPSPSCPRLATSSSREHRCCASTRPPAPRLARCRSRRPNRA
ncbi:DUF2254 family protein [Micromonospora sp. M12]